MCSLCLVPPQLISIGLPFSPIFFQNEGPIIAATGAAAPLAPYAVAQQSQLPLTAHYLPPAQYAPYHPYAATVVVSDSNAAAATNTGAPGAPAPINMLMKATQAVSPYKYHVTPSPHGPGPNGGAPNAASANSNHSMPPHLAPGGYGYHPSQVHYQQRYLYHHQHAPSPALAPGAQGEAGATASVAANKRSYPTPADIRAIATLKAEAMSRQFVAAAEVQAHAQAQQAVAARPGKKQKVSGSSSKKTGAKGEKYDRNQKSLGLLAKKFMQTFSHLPGGSIGTSISIDDASQALSVERRRVYDIINILEAVKIVTREKKNCYMWHGDGGLPKYFAELQAEAFLMWTEEAKSNGLLNDVDVSAFVPHAPMIDDEDRKEKSLGKITTRFLQLFLVGNESIGLTEVSDRILGTSSAKIEEKAVDNPEVAKRMAARMKTKIRRLYDVVNVLSALDIVNKLNVGSSYTRGPARPTFKWVYTVSPKELVRFRKASLLAPASSDNDAVARESRDLTPESKKVMASINIRGGDVSDDETPSPTLAIPTRL